MRLDSETIEAFRQRRLERFKKDMEIARPTPDVTSPMPDPENSLVMLAILALIIAVFASGLMAAGVGSMN